MKNSGKIAFGEGQIFSGAGLAARAFDVAKIVRSIHDNGFNLSWIITSNLYMRTIIKTLKCRKRIV